MWKEYYILKAIPNGYIPDFLFRLIEKDELFLSPNVKLSGIDKVAYIETSALADQFKEACMPRLQKRYGPEFDLELRKCESRENNYLQAKIERDSTIIKKRLATCNFSPNKPV